MNCQQTEKLISGYSDSELDLVTSLEIQSHLKACPKCSELLKNIEILRSGASNPALYLKAPSALRAHVRASILAESKLASRSSSEVGRPAGTLRRGSSTIGENEGLSRTGGFVRERRPGQGTFSIWLWKWLPAGLATCVIVIAAGLAAFQFARTNPQKVLVTELVSSHIRSLMADHIMDVASTDQHTVKPWFDGKLDFAPPVKDLAGRGFPLAGGRLDYVGARPVAALVYERHKHIINVFVWPLTQPPVAPATAGQRNGYNLVSWSDGSMVFWSVSDLNNQELLEFARAFDGN